MSHWEYLDPADLSLWMFNEDPPGINLLSTAIECWNIIPVSIKTKACQSMKMVSYWYPILLQRQALNSTTCWAIGMGFIGSDDSDDLSLRQVYKIEVLEVVLRALEEACIDQDKTRHVVWFSDKFNLGTPEVFDDAVRWLENSGGSRIGQRIRELGNRKICYKMLQHVFIVYAQFIQAMGVNREQTMTVLEARPFQQAIEKSEKMKCKGNEKFKKEKYDAAIQCYSQAIRYHPENHIIYGNRALCYIRLEQHLKAVADGKRASLIKPLWAKGHYRYCEALFYLGEGERALEANNFAQTLCKEDSDGTKDLEQQYKKFILEMENIKAGSCKGSSIQRLRSPKRTDATGSCLRDVRPVMVDLAAGSVASPNKDPEVKMTSQTELGKAEAHTQGKTKDYKQTKSETACKRSSKEPNVPKKKKSNGRNVLSKEQTMPESSIADVREALRSAVQDGCRCLCAIRGHNAEEAFSKALSLLGTHTIQDLGLSTHDEVLLIYGRASALVEIGQPEELAEAHREFQKMKSFEERTFQCFVYYGIGRVYLKENRYPLALERFLDSLRLVRNQIMPGVLKWPMTKEIVKESQPYYLKELLVNAIELCKFPPKPDAVCRHENCLGHTKTKIYFTDPDFKGFIQVNCSQSCVVEYHISCWKTLKTKFFDKNEKDFLKETCFTPNCRGKICSIKIYGSTGLIKCKFEADIAKQEHQVKLKVNQKCTSLKKLKSKEDRKYKRKQYKQASQHNWEMNHSLLEKEENVVQFPEKACSWMLYRDPVLHQIKESRKLFGEEQSPNMSALMKSLMPWMELDLSKGSNVAGRIIGGDQQKPGTLGQVADLMLERKNRVWARLLIQFLSTSPDTCPNLIEWAQQLDNAGLNAAREFIERYSGHMEKLDLAPLLTFTPVQDMLIEKFGTRPEFLNQNDLTVTEFLKQSPVQDMRLFIWALEEHRELYAGCHTILDQYFEVMDGHCQMVMKKSEDKNQDNSSMKTKNRGRKKKHKEPKGVTIFSGARGGTPRDERDFFEEDGYLAFLDPSEPFSIPDHIQEQVADFEDQFNCTGHREDFKHILDNSPDPTKERLYDYFAQILEEHGPLNVEDPLLVGELDNFPPSAQLKIEQAGGFKPFLLESLRFIMMGNCIGLAKHAIFLQETGHGNSKCALEDPTIPTDKSYLQKPHSAQPESYPYLPSPYVFGSTLSQLALPTSRIAGTVEPLRSSQQFTESQEPSNPQFPSTFTSSEMANLELYTSEVDEGGVGEKPSILTKSGLSLLNKPEAPQACHEAKRSVAINTEVYALFEDSNGDINKKHKTVKEFEIQIYKIVTDCDGMNQSHKDVITALEEDCKKIDGNIQVTNKELVLFQHKLEEVVKMDQQEKKGNQEALKTLKIETEDLIAQQEVLIQNNKEVQKSYDSEFNSLLELSNQSAAEKMILEDHIQRAKDLCAKAAKRSQAAQLSFLENCREKASHCLYRSLSCARAVLAKLEEVAPRYHSHIFTTTQNSWRACAKEAKEKITTLEAQYEEWMEQVRNGSRLSELPPVSISTTSQVPLPLMFLSTAQSSPEELSDPILPETSNVPVSAVESPMLCPQPSSLPASNLPQQQLELETQDSQPNHETSPKELHISKHDKALECLSTIFPDYTKPDLSAFVWELSAANDEALTHMDIQDVVSRVTQLILDQQEKTNSTKNVGLNVQHVGNPSPSPAWQTVKSQRQSQTKALNLEDPCIICHDDMSPEDVCVLECRHSFHKECIKSWLKEHSSCPTCREHALLPEDFPVLLGRTRRGHTPSAAP
ncbi:E3 ubiquitin-protein ligase TTC3 isoform X2 [Lampris incognitus]|uniref:E3 ubiquitin-protein ligase TTC3 isoform X2 n=1 Tax=Lampris incognitus TaxID=2546036 RepID=UPI0024B58E4B|nr:E3 ubiquitin-protein ligase TTC3 isoform X2 [Lampris incognitus]